MEFWAKGVEISLFLATTLLGGGGSGGTMPIKKLSLGAESYVIVTWKGFFTQPQVFLSSIVVARFD